jgi:peroxisomal enoyl-CoA hydratase 2
MKKRAQSFLPDFRNWVCLNVLLFLIIDWKRGVDGERYIEIIKPIPTTSKGKRFELRRETIGAYDKGKVGIVLEEQNLLVDADSGEVYTKMVGSSFFVGQVNFPHDCHL